MPWCLMLPYLLSSRRLCRLIMMKPFSSWAYSSCTRQPALTQGCLPGSAHSPPCSARLRLHAPSVSCWACMSSLQEQLSGTFRQQLSSSVLYPVLWLHASACEVERTHVLPNACARVLPARPVPDYSPAHAETKDVLPGRSWIFATAKHQGLLGRVVPGPPRTHRRRARPLSMQSILPASIAHCALLAAVPPSAVAAGRKPLGNISTVARCCSNLSDSPPPLVAVAA
jgi:hypothetical protein